MCIPYNKVFYNIVVLVDLFVTDVLKDSRSCIYSELSSREQWYGLWRNWGMSCKYNNSYSIEYSYGTVHMPGHVYNYYVSQSMGVSLYKLLIVTIFFLQGLQQPEPVFLSSGQWREYL